MHQENIFQKVPEKVPENSGEPHFCYKEYQSLLVQKQRFSVVCGTLIHATSFNKSYFRLKLQELIWKVRDFYFSCREMVFLRILLLISAPSAKK